ncbi:MAG: hypothetical protein CSB33_00650 [Desulfobacterales bacterium]|nr:MAG: hypothetical protein CSB33_00650 [Desulfobacterales bacterium]
MNACSGVSVGLVRAAVELLQGFDVKEPEIKKAEAEQPAARCPDCGGKLIYSYTILPHQMMSPPLPGLILKQQAVQRE